MGFYIFFMAIFAVSGLIGAVSFAMADGNDTKSVGLAMTLVSAMFFIGIGVGESMTKIRALENNGAHYCLEKDKTETRFIWGPTDNTEVVETCIGEPNG